MNPLVAVSAPLWLGLWMASAAGVVQAAQGEEPPVLPYQAAPGEGLEPEVTITETDRGTIHEYSVGGRVYMVKIVPQAGPPYYLLDTDGDGQLDKRSDDISNISIPQWVLFSW